MEYALLACLVFSLLAVIVILSVAISDNSPKWLGPTALTLLIISLIVCLNLTIIGIVT